MLKLYDMPEIVEAIHGHEGINPLNKHLNSNETIIRAQGQWPYILSALGISNSHLINKHGPCPICGGKDRFRFDDKMRGTFICNRCGGGDGVTLLRLYHGWSFPRTLTMISEILGCNIYAYHRPHQKYNTHPTDHNGIICQDKESVARHKSYLKTMWGSATDVHVGDPVDHYLHSRSINIAKFPNVLRYFKNMYYYENGKFIRKIDAMLAKVTDAEDNCIGIHRIYIENGNKANVASPKKLTKSIFPGAYTGSAIRLYEPVDGRIAVAEGIETALSFYILSGIPVWATLNTHGMKNVILPKSITEVVIAVDNDQSGVGQQAAKYLSSRLLTEGRTVKRITPPKVNHDFNDVLKEIKL